MATATEPPVDGGGRDDGLALVRLLHLSSPTLPVGAFTYSQGIEWAVERGWLGTASAVEAWLGDQLARSLCRLDLPLLLRMLEAVAAEDQQALGRWVDRLLAGRESAELRAEEAQRGRALAELLTGAERWRPLLARSQTAGLAFAAQRWGIDHRSAALGYAWAWAENLVLAAVKIVPLGQREGQRVLAGLATALPAAVASAARLEDDQVGASSPALAIASACHEVQYTRLFRS
jgi:urease accessory protein